ncbi:hypothetical protein DCC79_12745 [bacterium]|nr:DUF1566 domain-containing protein [Chloroflexi bacterium CFX6]RIL08840.1 MAG: hypothetical protein DCC79_12745 [bacterium]
MVGRKQVLGIVAVLLATSFATALMVRAGNPAGPGTPPNATSSYTLEDIHDRLESGAAGAQSTFTEPAAGPGTGTMHTLNEIMAKAPAADNANGAKTEDVLEGMTFWGLNAASGQWGLKMGTLPRTTAGNAEPACWDNENRYVNCENGRVTDTVTNLVWLTNADCFGKLDYAAANEAVARLASGTCGLQDGSSVGDWRLPTKAEWEATIARAAALGCSNPSLTNTAGSGCFNDGPQPFTNVKSDFYWSSTASADIPSDAWGVDLPSGKVINGGTKSNERHVWPVRTGQ